MQNPCVLLKLYIYLHSNYMEINMTKIELNNNRIYYTSDKKIIRIYDNFFPISSSKQTKVSVENGVEIKSSYIKKTYRDMQRCVKLYDLILDKILDETRNSVLRVLFYVLRELERNTGYVEVNIEDVARRLDLNERVVRNALKEVFKTYMLDKKHIDPEMAFVGNRERWMIDQLEAETDRDDKQYEKTSTYHRSIEADDDVLFGIKEEE